MLECSLTGCNPCQTIRFVYGPVYDAVLLCQIFLANTNRLLNRAVHKRQNYDQIRTVVSIDLGIYFSRNSIINICLYACLSISIEKNLAEQSYKW